ncbi:MAG: thiamine phosphate synthase [Pyrinomonadaceae bacterium]
MARTESRVGMSPTGVGLEHTEALIFTKPISYLITTGKMTNADFDRGCSRLVAVVERAVESGVSLIQIREKSLSARLLFRLTCSVVAATRGTSTRVLVNDRADIAFGAGADGVHLTGNSISPAIIRRSFGPGFLIGVSTHNVDDVVEVADAGADFAVFGPVFDTPGKSDDRKGVDELQRACVTVSPFPVVAIGGVDAGSVDEVMAAGASGVAAIRAFDDVDSMHQLLTKLK